MAQQQHPSPAGGFEPQLTLGIDGRIYCQDLTPELARILAAICPRDAALRARLETGAALQQQAGLERGPQDP